MSSWDAGDPTRSEVPNESNSGWLTPPPAPGSYGPSSYGPGSYAPDSRVPMPPPGYYTYPSPASSYQSGGAASTAMPEPASMAARFCGLLIDSFILAILTAAVCAPLGLLSHRSSYCDSQGACGSGFSISVGWQGDVIGLILGILYSAVLVGITTQTLGHRAVGVKVVNVNTGAPIGAGRGALRWLVMCVTGALCTLGYWSPFFDSRQHRGWHDQASNAIAISSR